MNTVWISITEHLPEDYEWVLISYKDAYNSKLRYTPSIGTRVNGFWRTKEGDVYAKFKDYSTYDFEREHRVIVTHWMPLPSTPK